MVGAFFMPKIKKNGGKTMDRIVLNGMKLNDAIKELTINARNDVHKRYAVECDNCILSIWTATHAMDEEQLGKYVEVALLDKEYEYIQVFPTWLEDRLRTVEEWDKQYAEIAYMPIMGIPLLINTFKHLDINDMEDVWNSFSCIADNYIV